MLKEKLHNFKQQSGGAQPSAGSRGLEYAATNTGGSLYRTYYFSLHCRFTSIYLYLVWYDSVYRHIETVLSALFWYSHPVHDVNSGLMTDASLLER